MQERERIAREFAWGIRLGRYREIIGVSWMSFARVNGGVVHFSDEGPRHAPVLVFVNALRSDFRIWDDVARILSRQFRLIRCDRRGHGFSEAGPDRYDMADYARDLSALLDRLGVARATVVGISMGGVIVQELYRQ